MLYCNNERKELMIIVFIFIVYSIYVYAYALKYFVSLCDCKRIDKKSAWLNFFLAHDFHISKKNQAQKLVSSVLDWDIPINNLNN